MLFVSAKVSQLNLLPQGKPEALRRAKAMLSKMDELGFGNCTNTRACEAECPKNISISNIARLNRDFIIAKLKDHQVVKQSTKSSLFSSLAIFNALAKESSRKAMRRSVCTVGKSKTGSRVRRNFRS